MSCFSNFNDIACAIVIFLSVTCIASVSVLFNMMEMFNVACYANLGIPPLCYSPDNADMYEDDNDPHNDDDDDVTVTLEEDDKDWYLYNEDGCDEALFVEDLRRCVDTFVVLPLTTSDGCPLTILP